MDTMEDLLYKARELGKAALEAAQDMADITKVKFAASQLRSEIAANYQKLGEITFELARMGAENPELIRMCVAELEKQNERLHALEHEIDEMRRVVRCGGCGATNAADSAYCARCGAPLEQPADARPIEPNA